jgi:hypothetical protein
MSITEVTNSVARRSRDGRVAVVDVDASRSALWSSVAAEVVLFTSGLERSGVPSFAGLDGVAVDLDVAERTKAGLLCEPVVEVWSIVEGCCGGFVKSCCCVSPLIQLDLHRAFVVEPAWNVFSELRSVNQ